MEFDKYNLSSDLTETLEKLYKRAVKINPALTEGIFIEGILREWLKPYKIKRSDNLTKDRVVLRNNLKEAVILSGKSQVQLAKEIGISRVYLRQLINLESEPSVTVALLIARALNYPPDRFTELFYIEPKQE